MKLFGTDGKRGKVNKYPITPEIALRVGMAAAIVLKKEHHGRNMVLIGKDTRLSGYMIESALTSGICSMGMNVTLVGPLPTPGIAFLTRALRIDAGVVISASHNPFYDNGKANFPARISFQVTSRIDSRTIIDTQGAEQLLGKGDMLLMLPGSRIMRIHGALVTEGEIKNIVDLIAVQGTPDYSIFNALPVEEPEQEMSGAERDEMYQKAIDFAEYVGEVSISSIQRGFKIGYNRAARIMELMEEDALVGPPRGAAEPRDFLRKRR